MKRLGFDIDGTLLPETPVADRFLTPPWEERKQMVNRLKGDGHFIALITARPWSDYRITEAWLKKHGIKYDVLVMGKFPVDLMLDDRSESSHSLFLRRVSS